MNMQHRVAAFLGQNNFDIHGPSADAIIDSLLCEMEEGLKSFSVNGHSTCAAADMIPTWMQPPKEPPQNISVIAIDAGGTNFRSCLVRFDEKGIPAISNIERHPMPATIREYSKQEFYETIASYLDHLKDKSEYIGFCFSYAMRITPSGDGEVMKFSKEIKATEVVGSFVGENLSAELIKRGWKKPRKIVLLNDTVAALLAGSTTALNGKKYSSYVGFILGTGTNAAYIEYGTIEKLNAIQDMPHLPAQIIVCESGKSNKLPRSVFDELFVQTTDAPNMYWFEKMYSGAYLGSIASIMLQKAAEDGLFSVNTADRFAALQHITLIDISAFLSAPYDRTSLFGKLLAETLESSEEDREILYRLLDALITRTARLAAAHIAAAVIKTGKGTNPALPVCVLAEGTTFMKTHALQTRIKGFLHTTLTVQRGIYYEVVTMENAVTLGTALAGLMQINV